MTIPALPDAPALGDSPEVFNTKAFAFVAALDDWGTAANAVAAAVDADATAADADAATATTQAGIATTKANEAAASAVDANSAELGAQAAQTAAELAATNAAASYDAFDDRYLGAKSSDPSVDNDGGALIIGALYFNTTDQKMKVYATLGWKDAGSAVNGTARRQSFTATAGQTSFTVTDGYDANFADVYLNGVKLVNGVDVTVSSGTVVVLASGAAAGDSVDVIAYGTFEVANTYTQAQADAEFLRKAGEDGVTVSGGNLGVTGGNATVASGYGFVLASTPATGFFPDDTVIGAKIQTDGGLRFFTGGATERVRIDTSGRLTLPYQPSATAQKASFTQGGSGWNEVTSYGTIAHNTGSHFNATTGKFTCPVAGKYLVTASQRSVDSSTNDQVARLQIWKNGGQFHANDVWASNAPSLGNATRPSCSVTAIVDCAAGDNISFATYSGAVIFFHLASFTLLG